MKGGQALTWLSTGRIVALLVLCALVLAGRSWLEENPQHNPWAPLDLRDPTGFATASKISALRGDPQQCRAVLNRSDVYFTSLAPTGEGECARPDRLQLDDTSLSPGDAETTCPVAVGLVLWLEKDVQPIAESQFGTSVARVEQLGTYSCRRMYGAASGRWSEHATGNAIDISAFVLEDGRRISLLADWNGNDEDAARFLRDVRDAACGRFGTVLSPDYNAAHADHFHFDQGRPTRFGACR